MDSDPEHSFNEIVEDTARLLNVPIVMVSIIDEDRVFAKANVGMPGIVNIERGVSLCSLAILKDELTVFTNVEDEPCLLSNPLAHSSFGLKFYAGAPIIDSDGYRIGSVCIVDKKQREFSESDREQLRQFAAKTMTLIERRIAII